MAPRKTSKPDTIDPVKVCTLALTQVKCVADYNRIGTVNSPETLTSAWSLLTESEQQCITDILNNDAQPKPQDIADELIACDTAIELKRVKSEYGDLVKAALKLLPQSERDRIKALCDTQAQPQPESQPKPETAPDLQPTVKKHTLIELTAELSQLDHLLDTIDSGNIPVELQTAVDELLAQREQTHEQLLEKIDNYAALIQSRAYWAATRKAELERLSKLIGSDQKAIDFLKGRLKTNLEGSEQRQIRTKRFNISICQNGGKAPLRLDNTPPEQMPERFQRKQIEPDRAAIRQALEVGEELSFASFAERDTHLRIR